MLNLLKKVFIDLDEDRAIIIAKRCLAAGYNKQDVIKALNEALAAIGYKYECKEYILSDLMMAGIIYEQIINMSEFDISQDIQKNIVSGLILLGTIESDIHDLGKSIFKNLAITSGFNVIDLGTDISPEEFFINIGKYKPDILAISSILTTTIPYIKETTQILTKNSLRDKVKIIIGGGIVNEVMCNFVGADAFSNDALNGVKICRSWVDGK
ncbi:MAG: cobalamin B12-binding domain-containing protein [Eubacteriales bacterium]